MLHNGSIRLCQIRVTLQVEHQVSYIGFALSQNVINRDQPRQKKPEIADLIAWLESSGDSVHYQFQWQNALLNGQTVQEIRNIFWSTDQMIRMFQECRQILIVDATYRSNHFNLKLLLFTVRTGNGKFSIVGLALLQHETSEDLRWAFLELLKAASIPLTAKSRPAAPTDTSSTGSSSQSNSLPISQQTEHKHSQRLFDWYIQGTFNIITCCCMRRESGDAMWRK